MSQNNTPTKPLCKWWSTIAQKALLGKTIIKIEYATAAALAEFDIDFDGDSLLLITFNDNTTWAVASDDEFNAPGALHLMSYPSNAKIEMVVLPTVPADA